MRPDEIQYIERLQQIINESAEIAKQTKNFDTRISRLDLALKKLYEIKDIANQNPEVKLSNLELLDFQLTKMKYEALKEHFED